jgi:predicted NUDIX family phosphoesterase
MICRRESRSGTEKTAHQRTALGGGGGRHRIYGQGSSGEIVEDKCGRIVPSSEVRISEEYVRQI